MFRVHHAIWISLLCLAACGGGGVDGPSDDDAPGVGSWLATSGRGRALTAGAGADGSAYLAGSFAGISTFGEDGEPGQTTLDSVGLDDALLARYAPDGTLLWAQLIARGDGSNTIRALAVLPGGDVVVAGSVDEGAIYAFGEPEETPIVDAGILLARVSPAGRLVWVARSQGGAAQAIVAHDDGTLSVAGFTGFNQRATLGTGEPAETMIEGSSRTLFLARYDAATGALIRARQDGRAGNMLGMDMAPASDGGVVVAGLFQHTATFGEGTATEASVDSGATFGAYLVRYDAMGNVVWVRSPQATGGRVQFEGVATLPGNAFGVAGMVANATAVLGAGASSETTLASDTEAFLVAVYEGDGDLRWARQSVPEGEAEARFPQIAMVRGGRIAITGTVEGTQIFGAGEAREQRIEVGQDSAAVVSLFEADGDHLVAVAAVGPETQSGDDVASFPQDGALLWTGRLSEGATFPPIPTPQDGPTVFLARLLPDDLIGP